MFAVSMRHLLPLAVLALSTLHAASTRAAECGSELYFDAGDVNNERPLGRPRAEFAKMRKLAIKGDVMEQRNLAIAYETGYLVSPCSDKAAYWYGKAARGGDEASQQWMERTARVERMRRGPECYENSCNRVAGEVVEAMVLEADTRGQYSAPVTINGVTVRGLVDTGATAVSMSSRTAQQMGIAYLNGRRVQMNTANGVTSGYAVTLNAVTVGRLTLPQVRAVVSESEMPVLIGASFLSRVSIATDGRRMTLTKR